MKAAYINKYGAKETLQVGEVREPAMGDTDVFVKIHAASLNPIDFKLRNGMLRLVRSYNFPLVLGHDCAGVVEKVGAKVKNFKVGDHVFARPSGDRIGTLAEYIAIDENEVAIMPNNLTFEEAASLPLVGLTSWQTLMDKLNLKKGEKIFISAGSGGVGTFAIQLAKYLGAEVWTTTSAKNTELVQNLGADHVIDYNNKNFDSNLKNFDAVFDTLGSNALSKSFSYLKPGGTIATITGSPDHKTAREWHLGPFKSALLALVGLKMNLKARAKSVTYKYAFMQPSGHQLGQIAKLVETKVIMPVIDKVFSLGDVQAAINYSESGRARGKIIIKII